MARTAETVTEQGSTKALYTGAELDRMTDDALDELLEHYEALGEHEHAESVQHVIDERQDVYEDRCAEDEQAYEAEQDHQQRLHDDMVDSMYADGLIG